jgi:hypothetical protein
MQFRRQPVPAPQCIHGKVRKNIPLIRIETHDPAFRRNRVMHAAWLHNVNAEVSRPMQQQLVKIRTPGLQASPCSIFVSPENLKRLTVAGANTRACVSYEPGSLNLLPNPQLPQQGFNARMQRFAGSMSGKRTPFNQNNPGSGLCAADGSRRAGWPASSDRHIERRCRRGFTQGQFRELRRIRSRHSLATTS